VSTRNTQVKQGGVKPESLQDGDDADWNIPSDVSIDLDFD